MAVIDNGLPNMPIPSADDMRDWDNWLSSRPESVKSIAVKIPPWFYYDMPTTEQIVTIQAYAEDGTVRVLVVGDRISIPALTTFEVFGVSPDDLVKRA